VPADLVQEKLERVGRTLRGAGGVDGVLAYVDSAGGQLAAQLVQLAIGELVFAGVGLELALLDLAALLDLLEEDIRVSQQVQRSSSFPGLAAPFALEALDPRPCRGGALLARVGGMARCADVEPGHRLRRADLVARSARRADRGRTHKLGLDCRLHGSPSVFGAACCFHAAR